MQPLELVSLFVEPLERSGFPYMITGSVASIFYGTPRVTYDVDLVLQITDDQIEEFVALFPSSDFYCPPVETIRDELLRLGNAQFNLLHPESGFKADIYPVGDFIQRWGLERRRRFEQGSSAVWVAPPEYVILRKLEYFQEGGSSKHLSDIQGILALKGKEIDLEWIRTKAADYDLVAAWRRINWPNNG